MLAALRFATFLAPCNRALYEHVADVCGASELVDGVDWRELNGPGIDLAFVCSPPLIWLGGAVEAIAAPVLTDPQFGGLPLYCSDVVVPADSTFMSLADLRGKRWAVNEPGSWSGYWVTLKTVGSWSYFRHVVKAGFHQKALRMVAAWEVDGSAIDRQVLAVEMQRHPELTGQVRVVGSLGPAPSQPVVVRADLEQSVKDRLQRCLLSMRGTILLEHYVKRFVPAPDYRLVAEIVGTVGLDGSVLRAGSEPSRRHSLST